MCVSYRWNCCSVSHLLVGREVNIRVTESTVEVFLAGERVAHPPMRSGSRNRHSTRESDVSLTG